MQSPHELRRLLHRLVKSYQPEEFVAAAEEPALHPTLRHLDHLDARRRWTLLLLVIHPFGEIRLTPLAVHTALVRGQWPEHETAAGLLAACVNLLV